MGMGITVTMLSYKIGKVLRLWDILLKLFNLLLALKIRHIQSKKLQK